MLFLRFAPIFPLLFGWTTQSGHPHIRQRFTRFVDAPTAEHPGAHQAKERVINLLPWPERQDRTLARSLCLILLGHKASPGCGKTITAGRHIFDLEMSLPVSDHTENFRTVSRVLLHQHNSRRLDGCSFGSRDYPSRNGT